MLTEKNQDVTSQEPVHSNARLWSRNKATVKMLLGTNNAVFFLITMKYEICSIFHSVKVTKNPKHAFILNSISYILLTKHPKTDSISRICTVNVGDKQIGQIHVSLLEP